MGNTEQIGLHSYGTEKNILGSLIQKISGQIFFINFAFWLHRSEGIQKLVTLWNECVENNGDFVEIRRYCDDSILHCFKKKHVPSNFCLTHAIR